MEDDEKTMEQLRRDIDEMRRANAELAAAAERLKGAEASLLESELRFRSVASSAVDAIISIDTTDRVTFWNQAAERIFGYSHDEIMGQSIIKLIPGPFRRSHQEGVKRYLRIKRPVLIGRTAELMGLRKDGTLFPLELSLSTWETGEGIFFSGIIRDISYRKEVEKALEKRTEEASERTEELESLIQMVAHDLKSPVITAAGFLRILRSMISKRPHDAKMDQILDQIGTATQTMERFLTDLLDGLQVEHLAPTRVCLQPDEIIHDALLRHKLAIEEKAIKVHVEKPDSVPSALGDHHRIGQVLDNLLSNAIKHMGSIADPTIRVTVVDDNGFVIVKVSDNGVGIPVEYQARIFDRFFRVSKSGPRQGTGLGLSIAKKIVESLGGRIWVESEVGEGATFGFSLPKVREDL
jgi:PAS domain S-box-containing protein